MINKTRGFLVFDSAKWMGLIALLIVLGLSYRAFFQFSDADRHEYKKLMQVSNPTIVEDSTKTPYTARQKRAGIQKDVFFNQGNHRLHLRILSEHAELVLDQREEATEIVEHMHGVKCLMQEDVYYLLPDGREADLFADTDLLVSRGGEGTESPSKMPLLGSHAKPMQVIRYLEAETASYFYKSDRFVAENVLVARYVVPGHLLVESIEGMKPVMMGSATSAAFSLAGKNPDFKARRLKAKLYSGGKL